MARRSSDLLALQHSLVFSFGLCLWHSLSFREARSCSRVLDKVLNHYAVFQPGLGTSYAKLILHSTTHGLSAALLGLLSGLIQIPDGWQSQTTA